MPSPRAVLADIEELSLDPTKSYTTVSSTGRLKHVKQEQEQQVKEVAVLVVATEKVDVATLDPVLEEKEETVEVDVAQLASEEATEEKVVEKKERKLKKKPSSESESS